MRIAFVADTSTPNGWYRGIGPMQALIRRGHEVRQVMTVDGGFHADRVDGCELLHVHRMHDARTLALIDFAKRQRIPVVWDNDDDLASVPRNNAAYKEFGGLRGQRANAAIRRVVQLADLVTTPSRRLAEIYRGYGAARAEVIENYVRDESRERASRRRGERLTVGWLAGREHHVDVERMDIADTLEQLLGEHERLEVVSIGVGLGIRSPRYRHVPRVRFDELDDELARLDVGIAPIADIPLNQARSNVKLKEYAVLGTPWLASPVGAYVGMGEEQGGRLVADGDWHAALTTLLTRDRDRRKLAKKALKWGQRQTVTANVREWEERFERLRGG